MRAWGSATAALADHVHRQDEDAGAVHRRRSGLPSPPGAGGEQMFRALKYRHVPTAMVQFPGESHELSRSGKPRHRVERLEHIVAWMDKYVTGAEIKTYDIQ